MAGPACKTLINNLTRAIGESLEEILKSPLVRGPMIEEKKANNYLQRLVDLDLTLYNGDPTSGVGTDSLQRIVKDLVEDGVFTVEVWEILRPPAE